MFPIDPNKRHNSVLNPTQLKRVQLSSPQVSKSTSNSSSLQNCNIAPQKVTQYLQQHSLFPPYEPVDNTSCVYDSSDERDNNDIVKQITDLVDNDTVNLSSPSSHSGDNDEEDDDYDNDHEREIQQFASQFKKNKRKSDGQMFLQMKQFQQFMMNNSNSNKQEEMHYNINPNYLNNNLYNNNNSFNQYSNYNNVNVNANGNYNAMAQMKMAQFIQSQTQNNMNMNMNINQFRRYSHLNSNQFTVKNKIYNQGNMNSMTNNNNSINMNNNKKHNPYKPNIQSQYLISPNKNQQQQLQQPVLNPNSIQKQLVDEQFFFQNLLTVVKDQVGSRLVQEKLEVKKEDLAFLKQFYSIVKPSLLNIINDTFGNYAMQKFIEVLITQRNKDFITEFFNQIKTDLLLISIDNFGSRFFQKFLSLLTNGIYSYIETPELNDVLKSLIKKHLFSLCFDKNGNHVFQKILVIYPKDKNDFIYDELEKYTIDISKLQQNVVILQTVFKVANKIQKSKLVNAIIDVIDQLINDEYGNFLITYIIDNLEEEEYIKRIYEYITGNMMMLSQKKYSSNVIDKFIEAPNNSYSIQIVHYLNDNKLAKDMIVHEYGNYVIQKALKVSDGKLFMSLVQQIEPMLETLMQLPIGRKIYSSLIMNYGDYFQNSNKLIQGNQIQMQMQTMSNSNNNSNSHNSSHNNSNSKKGRKSKKSKVLNLN